MKYVIALILGLNIGLYAGIIYNAGPEDGKEIIIKSDYEEIKNGIESQKQKKSKEMKEFVSTDEGFVNQNEQDTYKVPKSTKKEIGGMEEFVSTDEGFVNQNEQDTYKVPKSTKKEIGGMEEFVSTDEGFISQDEHDMAEDQEVITNEENGMEEFELTDEEFKEIEKGVIKNHEKY